MASRSGGFSSALSKSEPWTDGPRRHFERGVLGLAGPRQRGVEMRVVRVAMLGGVPVGGLGDQPDGWVVLPLLALVVVLLDAALTGCWLVLGLA